MSRVPPDELRLPARSLLHPPALPAVGARLLGRFRLAALLDRGPGGAVYRAVDERLGAQVAVKVLLADGNRTPSALGLSHPNIARLHLRDLDPPWEVRVMELVAGEPLDAYCARHPRGRLSTRETLAILLGCLDALEHAHALGVMHDGIKPRQLLWTRSGGVKLCDFALGRPPRGPFAAPERRRRQPASPRSDLFSLAVTLWAGGNGCAGEDLLGRRLLAAGPSALPASEHLPFALHDVLWVAAALDPDDRYACAADLRRELRAVAADLQRERSAFAVARVTREIPVGAAPESAIVDDPTSRVMDRPPRARPAPPPGPAGMASVPAWRFRSRFGGQRAVGPFSIDRLPVTNGQYLAYLEATGAAAPAGWHGGLPDAGRLDHPVVGVTLDQARAFAAWQGKRLPTALEWEAAARWPDGRRYPWGLAFHPGLGHCPETGAASTAPVGRYPAGAAPSGCLDLVGNVWEWTEPDPAGPPAQPGHTWVLGGSYRHRCAAAAGPPSAERAVDAQRDDLGFRCAASLAST